jgi:two-component system, cell cycle response regulator DivK
MGSRRIPIPSTDEAIHVLVVDDDPDALDIYRQYLSFVGMDVVTARDGREAIVRARIDLPDVVVMDISMPLMEGGEAATVLRKEARTRAIPIIAMSAFGGLARSKVRHAPFIEFCSKPLLPERLAEVITSVVTRRRRERYAATVGGAAALSSRRRHH